MIQPVRAAARGGSIPRRRRDQQPASLRGSAETCPRGLLAGHDRQLYGTVLSWLEQHQPPQVRLHLVDIADLLRPGRNQIYIVGVDTSAATYTRFFQPPGYWVYNTGGAAPRLIAQNWPIVPITWPATQMKIDSQLDRKSVV